MASSSVEQNVAAYRYLKGSLEELQQKATQAGGLQARYSSGKGGKTYEQAIAKLQAKLSPLESRLTSAGFDVSTLTGQNYTLASPEKIAARQARGQDVSQYVTQQQGGQAAINRKQTGLISPTQREAFPGVLAQEQAAKGVSAAYVEGPSSQAYVYGADVLDKKANDAAVNHLYQQYFQRDATAAELANWGASGGADTTVRALEDFLKSEQTKYGYTPTPTAAAPAGDRKLGPSEYNSLRQQFGVSEANFDQYFRRDAQGNIYLKADALSVTPAFSGGSVPENVEDVYEDSLTDATFATGANPYDAFIESMKAVLNYKSEEELRLTAERNQLMADLKEQVAEMPSLQAEYAKALGEQEVPELRQKLRDLDLQIAQKMAEYEQTNIAIQGQTTTMGLIVGQQGLLKQQMAVDIGLLQMQRAVYEGDLQFAQSMAEKSVELMFADREREIEYTKMFLDVNASDLSREESKTASQIQFMLNERERVLNEQKAEKEQIVQLMLGVAQAGGDVSVLSLDKSLEENLKLAAPYLAPVPTLPEPTKLEVIKDADGNPIGSWDPVTNKFYEGVFDTVEDNAAVSSFDAWVQEVGSGVVTQDFATPVSYIKGRDIHGGLDIDGTIGDSVTSPISGVVTSAGNQGGWGNTVVIRDANGNSWRLAHMQSLSVSVGSSISSGQQVGILGNTGTVYSEGGDGSHLHIEVKDANGNLLDPRQAFQLSPQQKFTQEFYQTDEGLKVAEEERQAADQFENDILVKEFRLVQDKFFAMKNMVETGTRGPADIALVYEFMKALDPTSVVREAEFDNASKSGNIFAGIWARFNGQWASEGGGMLPENVRSAFIDLIRAKAAAKFQSYEIYRDQKTQVAIDTGLNPDHAVPDAGLVLDEFLREIDEAESVPSDSSSDREIDTATERYIQTVVEEQQSPYALFLDWLFSS